MQNGQKITHSPERLMKLRTLVFVLLQKEHPKYKRKGDDIFVEHTLSLTEALCGFQVIFTHLDNSQLLIKSQPGAAFLCINGPDIIMSKLPGESESNLMKNGPSINYH